MITVACSLLYEIANNYSISISEFKELLQISQHLKNYPSWAKPTQYTAHDSTTIPQLLDGDSGGAQTA